jgi:hypothetical protein
MTMKTIILKKPLGVIILILLLSLQSCALITSYKKFSLERDPNLMFKEKMTFSGVNRGVLFFFEDGTMLFVAPMSSDMVEDYFKDLDYEIYGRFSDYRLHWGRYQVEQDSIQLELLEKVHQAGFNGITRWKAVLKNQGKELEVLPGPVNRKVSMPYYPTFPYKGNSYFEDSTLQEIKIDPAKAWVNK